MVTLTFSHVSRIQIALLTYILRLKMYPIKRPARKMITDVLLFHFTNERTCKRGLFDTNSYSQVTPPNLYSLQVHGWITTFENHYAG